MDVEHKSARFRFGPFEVNVRARELARNGRRVRLPGLPFEVLVVLIEHAGEPVSREDLHRRLWPAGTFVDFDNNLNSAIARVRQTLGDSAERPRFIATIPRVGYQFIAPVERGEAAAPPAAPLVPRDGGARPPAPRPPTDASGPASRASANHPFAGRSMAGNAAVRQGQRAWRSLAYVAGLVAVAGALAAGGAVRAGRTPSAPSPTAGAAAFDRGRELLARGEAKAAATELQRAISLDPGHARAHSTLAHALHKMSTRSLVQRPIGTSVSVAEAERGVTLDPQCGACQGTLGFFLFYHDWQWVRAEQHLQTAIALEPDSGAIRPSYALLLIATGRLTEALDQIDIALQKSPYETGWLAIRASILYASRRYPEALAAADRVLAVDDRDRAGWEWRSRALFQLGRRHDAVRALGQGLFATHATILEQEVESGGADAGLRALLAITSDWQARLDQSWRRATWRALLGDRDAALDEIEQAYRLRNYNLMYLGVDPIYDGLRAHPRFKAILSGVGLSPVADAGGGA